MKREQLSEIICNIDDRHVSEACEFHPDSGKRSPERIGHMIKKRWISIAVAAVLIFAMSIGVYAAYQKVASPQAAQAVALEELETWKNMGLLSRDVQIEGDANTILNVSESVGDDYWYGRLFTHRYDVIWESGKTMGPKYGCLLSVDTLTGKIMTAVIDARADDDDVPVQVIGPEDPDALRYYDNYTDIFPADMTVDRFCSLLAEYWGFSGYTLAETVDETYGTDYDAIDGSTLLKDLNNVTGENYYLTVFFDGDQDGAPMYVQLQPYPGYVSLTVGTGHGVG